MKLFKKTKVIVVTLVLSVSIFVIGCADPYANQGTHLYHHSQPSTGQALQSLGEIGYQLGGKKVSPEKYNDNMRALGALGLLMDYAK